MYEIYFKLDDFILFLKTNTFDSDGIKVKAANVIREISSCLSESLKPSFIKEYTFPLVHFIDSKIPSLHNYYKGNFTECQWTEICLFEYRCTEKNPSASIHQEITSLEKKPSERTPSLTLLGWKKNHHFKIYLSYILYKVTMKH